MGRSGVKRSINLTWPKQTAVLAIKESAFLALEPVCKVAVAESLTSCGLSSDSNWQLLFASDIVSYRLESFSLS